VYANNAVEKKAMRESKIEGYLRAEVAKLGGWMEKHTSPGTKGPPDNLVMWRADPHCYAAGELAGEPATVEFIETKAPDGKPTVLQARDHKRRREMGFQVHVISTMEQAEEYLKSRGKR
jgi:hypothetical protein